MSVRMLRRAAAAAAIVVVFGSQAVAQRPPSPQTPQTRVDGQIHDFTAALDASGPWEISGEWSLALNTASGKVEFQAALNMVRAENAARQSHTHHIVMNNGSVTPITGGFRISGDAAVTVNGPLAGFSPTPLDIDLTGSSAVRFSNVKLTFSAPGAGHFGDQPIDGVVSLR